MTVNGIKNIEDIQVGDWVIADDPTTPGGIEAKQVLDTFVRETDALVDLYVDGEVISTTGEHPFWTPDLGWVEAKDLVVGSLLQTGDGRVVDVDKIEKREGKFPVYNFRVEGIPTYFVSELGILVHNACQPVLEDVTTGPHGPDRSFETVVARAIKEKIPQGRWLSRGAGERAVANLDISKMKVGEPYSVPLNPNEGEIIRIYGEYPDMGTPASQRYIKEPANRSVVIRQRNDRIHTFPIGPEHPAYNVNAPTL